METLRSIWMNAWDLEGIEPTEIISQLKDLGLNGCNLTLSYHGGRMLLPRRRKVFEQQAGALYFPANLSSYDTSKLRPRVAPQSKLVAKFVEICRQKQFEVNAWTVLCHNDFLGSQVPDCCIQNVFGDRYTYALCPSNPDIRRYVVALCADIADFGAAQIDLEALSFMGYEHQGLHDKSGIPLASWAKWLLSVCVCRCCREKLGAFADEITTKARARLENYFDESPAETADFDLEARLAEAIGADALAALLEMRRQTLISLLDEIRKATGGTHLNVRAATSPLFTGGKTALSFEDLASRADSATVTFIGATKEKMRAELALVPPPEKRPLPIFGGFSFHHPDCQSREDVSERLAMMRDAKLDGFLFYLYGLASTRHLAWLKAALAAN